MFVENNRITLTSRQECSQNLFRSHLFRISISTKYHGTDRRVSIISVGKFGYHNHIVAFRVLLRVRSQESNTWISQYLIPRNDPLACFVELVNEFASVTVGDHNFISSEYHIPSRCWWVFV